VAVAEEEMGRQRMMLLLVEVVELAAVARGACGEHGHLLPLDRLPAGRQLQDRKRQAVRMMASLERTRMVVSLLTTTLLEGSRWLHCLREMSTN
jgi:hypothetical protein